MDEPVVDSVIDEESGTLSGTSLARTASISRKKSINIEKPKPVTSFAAFKQVALATFDDATHHHESPFEKLSDDTLRLLLVHNQIEIRGAKHCDHGTLVTLCEEVIPIDFPIPVRSDSFNFETISEMNFAALKIQKAYFRWRDRTIRAQRVQQENTELTDPKQYVEPSEQKSFLRRIKEGDVDDKEVEVEWIKPSWKVAKNFEATMRPHKPGKDMKKYNWNTVTLGRHCMAGGCGEQLDLWNEGQTSEFSQFGTAITGYFKFLKWCCWTMLILSFLHLPMVVLNTFGPTAGYSTASLALLSYGNIGAGVGEIKILGCNQAVYQQAICILDKKTIVSYYSMLDAAGTCIIIIAWLWLRRYEKNEVIKLEKSMITASDYTLCAHNIPPNTTEKELAVHFAEVTGEPIAAVHLAYANSTEIKAYFKRGELVKKRTEIVQKIRHLKTMQRRSIKISKRKLKKLTKRRDHFTEKIRLKEENQNSIRQNYVVTTALQGFVTFETEMGFIKAMSSYQLSWIRSFCNCFYPKHLKFKGNNIKVKQAPEPSTIIWENLEYSSKTRSFRKLLTTGIATISIIFSVLFTFLAKDFKNNSLKTTSKICPDGFDSLLEYMQLDIIRMDPELSHCYCSDLSAVQQGQEFLCYDFLQSKIQSRLMSTGAGFMVVFMNSVFTFLMNMGASFEKHHSMDGRENSMLSRVFLLKFVNTGCLVLLYNQTWLQALVNVRFSAEPTFGTQWYESGGTSTVIVIFMSIFSPHVSPLLQYVRHRMKIRNIERNLTEDYELKDNDRSCYTQEDLNKVYIGPNFSITNRYTQILVTYWICWMFSTGIPILPVLGTISFYATYWVDKFLFCNFYRTPPMYGETLGKTSTRIVGLGIIVHLSMSLCILGSEQIVEFAIISDNNILVWLMSLFILYMIVGYLLTRFGNQAKKIVQCIVCSRGSTTNNLMKKMNTIQVDYSSARNRGIIKGLASYNILENPKYRDAFAITDEFAQHHCHLSSIRNLNTIEETLNIEDTV